MIAFIFGFFNGYLVAYYFLRVWNEKKLVDTGTYVDQKGCIAGGDIVGGDYVVVKTTEVITIRD